MRLSTIRRGVIGENLVVADCLTRGMDVYKPCVDDKTVELLVLINSKPITIQVKNHKSMNTKSSISISIKATKADVIAVPYEGKVFYFKNERKNERWGLSIAIKTPRNNQKQYIHFAKDYEDFPYDNI